MTLHILLLISFSIVHLHGGQALDASGILDQVLTAVKADLKAKHQESMPVPDVENTFKEGLLKGGAKASGGVFSDLSTVQRSGPATMTMNGTSATVHVVLSLQVMKVTFSHARVWLGPISSSDAFSVTVKTNTIDAQITLTIAGACNTKLDFVHFTDFKDITVDLKGVASVMEPLTNALVNHFHNDIGKAVEVKMSDMLAAELKKNALCSLVQG